MVSANSDNDNNYVWLHTIRKPVVLAEGPADSYCFILDNILRAKCLYNEQLLSHEVHNVSFLAEWCLTMGHYCACLH